MAEDGSSDLRWSNYTPSKKAQRLLVISTLILVCATTGIAPKEIPGLGLTITEPSRSVLLRWIFIIVIYLFIDFMRDAFAASAQRENEGIIAESPTGNRKWIEAKRASKNEWLDRLDFLFDLLLPGIAAACAIVAILIYM